MENKHEKKKNRRKKQPEGRGGSPKGKNQKTQRNGGMSDKWTQTKLRLLT